MTHEPHRIRTVVLVVEDEPLLRLSAIDIVEDAGFEAVEASNSTEAIAILERRLDIRIVFTDINMPGGFSGIQLAACIRDRWPPIEILVTSGQIAPTSAELPVRGVFLPKPFRPVEVAAVLHRMAA